MQRADAIGLHYALGQRIEGYNISIGRPVVLIDVPLGGQAMTAANGIDHDAARRQSAAAPLRRQCRGGRLRC